MVYPEVKCWNIKEHLYLEQIESDQMCFFIDDAVLFLFTIWPMFGWLIRFFFFFFPFAISISQFNFPFWRISSHQDSAALYNALDMGFL